MDFKKCTLIFLINYILGYIECSQQQLSCGSVVKLYNSAYRVRLHSHDVKYGSGSGQQSVTGTDVQEDVNSHWVIRGTPAQPCKRGVPVKCGDNIRLQHLTTSRNLHSHAFSSPLSGGQEVSAFGEEGEGDTGDYWIVVCTSDYWMRDTKVTFKHKDTDMYLSISGKTYGRPIHGQMEVCAIHSPDSSTQWQVTEGLFIKPSDFDPTSGYRHTEL